MRLSNPPLAYAWRSGLVGLVFLAAIGMAAADDLFSDDPFAEAAPLESRPENNQQERSPEPDTARQPDRSQRVPAAPQPSGQPPQPDKQAPGERPGTPPAAISLSLRLPITGTRDTQFMAAVLRQLPALEQRAGQRSLLVVRCDGTPDAPSDFGRSLELARFLSGPQLARVKTVAWIPESISGHAVLVALACEEIVMAPTASLGPVEKDATAVDGAMRAAYAEIASRRQTFPPAVAVAMLDPAARVVRAMTSDGERFVGKEELPGLRDSVAVLDAQELGPSPLIFTARDAREAGFVQWLADSPEEVALRLNVPAAVLMGDPSLEGGWRARQVPLNGPIDAALVARVRARMAEAIDDGVNLICLRIDSPGGSAEQSLVLATALARLDPTAVRTVAWVPEEALSDAALVAMACDDLVMSADAVIGGEGAGSIDRRSADALVVAWREAVAKPRDRFWSLPVALVVPGVEVRQMTSMTTGQVVAWSPQERAEQADPETWREGPQIGVGPLRLSGRTAESLGITAHLAESAAELSAAYGLQGEMAIVEPGWVDQLFDALAQPGVAWLLLLIGGAGLYIELHTPGLGLGGFVAMVAFIVYFWSQYLQGTAGWLEVMLFLAGLFCLAAEIFVLPGFGVLGLGGGLLVVGSLVLASQSFILPTNDYQVRQLQYSLAGLLAAGVGVVAMAVMLRRWLPATPVLRNVLLVPPQADGLEATEGSLDHLLGLEGMTTSRLAPAGKARIDGRVQDVVVEGGLIEPGRTVRVTEVRAGRVIVREVS